MKTFQKTRVKLTPRKEEELRYIEETYLVDSSGKTLNRTIFNPDGSISHKVIFRHFEDGAVKEYIVYDTKDVLLERHFHEKGDNGYLAKSIFEYENGQKIIKTFVFNEDTHTEKVTITDQDGDLLGYEIYVFDESDNVISEKEIDSNGNEITTYRKDYDDSNIIQKEGYYLEGILQSTTRFTYNESNKLVKSETEDFMQGTKTTDEFKYDLKGNQVYTFSTIDGVIIFENKCTYDNANDIIEEEYFQIDPYSKSILEHSKIINEELSN